MNNPKRVVFVSCIGDVNDSHTLLYITTLKSYGFDLYGVRCFMPDKNYDGVFTRYWQLKTINNHFWPSGIRLTTAIKAIITRSRNSFLLLKVLMTNKFDYVVATEPDSLVIAVISSYFSGHKVVFDLREIFEDRVFAINTYLRPFASSFLKVTLRLCDLSIAKIIHVSKERADFYSYLKSDKEIVVYSPPLSPEPLRVNISKNEPLVFIHAGSLRKNYHSQELLLAFKELFLENVNVRLIVIGGIAEKLDNHDVVDFLIDNDILELIEKIPSHLVNEVLERAHVGISFVSKIDHSHRLAQPRKLYEYLSKGLPVLVSDNETISKVVEKNNCGWVTNSADIKSIVESVKNIEYMREEIFQYGVNAYSAHTSTFNWESQIPKLVSIFK